MLNPIQLVPKLVCSTTDFSYLRIDKNDDRGKDNVGVILNSQKVKLALTVYLV